MDLKDLYQAAFEAPDGVLRRVQEHLRARRYREALALLERSKEALPPPLWEDLVRGIRSLEENPESFLDHPFLGAEAWNLLGLKRLGDKAEAEVAFKEALARDPGHVRALVNLGNLHLERDEVEEAIRFYQEALRVDPDLPQAHHNLAAAYRRKGDLDRAVQHLKKSQRLLMRPSEGKKVGTPGWALLLLLALLLYLILRQAP
ncbi:MAG: tetratricopeptide repeat protein [Thermaceae bacterium]